MVEKAIANSYRKLPRKKAPEANHVLQVSFIGFNECHQSLLPVNTSVVAVFSANCSTQSIHGRNKIIYLSNIKFPLFAHLAENTNVARH